MPVNSRGGVEDPRLEAKDAKKIPGQGQGQPYLGQTLTRPTTEMFEAKAKDQGHNAEVISKKKSSLQNFVNFPENSSVLQENKCHQKVFRKLSGVLQDKTKLIMTLARFQQVKK